LKPKSLLEKRNWKMQKDIDISDIERNNYLLNIVIGGVRNSRCKEPFDLDYHRLSESISLRALLYEGIINNKVLGIKLICY